MNTRPQLSHREFLAASAAGLAVTDLEPLVRGIGAAPTVVTSASTARLAVWA